MTDLTDQDDKAIRAIGLGPDNAGQDHPVRKDDGGPASEKSLRDEIAIAAMQAMIAAGIKSEEKAKLLPTAAYLAADAMLIERAKK